MKKLLFSIALLVSCQVVNGQDTQQIQLKLDRFERQSNAGLRVFYVGCFIAAGTLCGVEQMSGGDNSAEIKKGLYGLSVAMGAAGIIIHMDASRRLKSDLSVSPGKVSLNF